MVANITRADEIASRKELGVAVQNVLECKTDTRYILEVQSNKAVLNNLVRLGVQMNGAEYDGPAELTYRLPPGVSVFGYDAKTLFYAADSGSLAYVEIPAGTAVLKKLAIALQLAPISEGRTVNYRKFGYTSAQYYRETSMPVKDNPYPDTIVAGLEYKDGSAYVTVGCETFDY